MSSQTQRKSKLREKNVQMTLDQKRNKLDVLHHLDIGVY